MSLDVLQIPPAMADHWDPYGNAETQTMVFLTMIIGWGEITEENYLDWYVRARSWELAVGPLLYEIDEANERMPRLLTHGDVKRYIGLRTNVFSKLSDLFFAQKIRRVLEEKIDYELRKEGLRRQPVITDEQWVVVIDRDYDEEGDYANSTPTWNLRLYNANGAMEQEYLFESSIQPALKAVAEQVECS